MTNLARATRSAYTHSMRKLSRRSILLALLASPFIAYAYAWQLERRWIKTTRLTINPNGTRIAHITDIHYLGDKILIKSLIKKIHASNVEMVFFTGDLIDSSSPDHLDEALDFITQIKLPVYGVAGNHDPIDRKSVQKYRTAFKQTGGDWLERSSIELDQLHLHPLLPGRPLTQGTKNKPHILLTHYPETADGKNRQNHRFDLILAGHSHGGQVRLPVVGPLLLPTGVGDYDRGLFDTPMGKLYVNVGIGTFVFHVRFLCRPELAIIKV